MNSERPQFQRTGPKKEASGHEKVLAAIRNQGRRVTVELNSRDEKVEGHIVGGDKFTITVKDDSGRRLVIFKHAIDLFYAEEGEAQKDA